MKKWLLSLSAAAIIAAAPAVFAQGQGNGNGQGPSKDELPIQLPYGTHLTQKHSHGPQSDELKTSGNDSKTGNAAKPPHGGGGGGGGSTPLQTWSATVTSPIDQKTYTFTMVGQNPATSNTSTPITTYLIPLRVNFQYSRTTTYSFDPTVSDSGCLGGTNTATTLTANSPIFQESDYNLGGTEVGTAQYVDAYQRANFWSDVSVNTNYKTELSLMTKSLQSLTVTSGNTGFVNGTVYIPSGTQCGSNTGNTNHVGYLGVVSINSVDAAVHSLITQLGIPSNAFPVFLLYNAVMSEGSPTNLNNCCVLGYHSITSGGQTYGVAEFEGRDNTVFSGVADITALSHEVAEWMDDPTTNNPTPAWGHVGQVSTCQSNLENGDPLSGTQFPAITMSNGFTYHPQELAFASWFFRTPSPLPNGTWHSNNGTFTQDAGAVCH